MEDDSWTVCNRPTLHAASLLVMPTKHRVTDVPVTDLTPHPENARRGNVAAIVESLSTFGQYRPIVVQASTKHILAGNHTWQAATELGWKTVSAVLVDVDDTTAKRILVADNRLNDLAAYDHEALIDLLQSLEGDLQGTGFTDEDVLDLLAAHTPPSLDDLEREHPMDDDAEAALWPTVRVKVPPHVHAWWGRVFAAQPGDSDVDRMESVLLVLDPTKEYAPAAPVVEDEDDDL